MAKHILLVFSVLLIAIVIPVQGLESGIGKVEFADDDPALSISAYNLTIGDMYTEAGLAGTGLSLPVFGKAITGYLNLKAQGQLSDKELLTVIDFEKSSNQKRLWVIDLKNRKVLYNSLVAHGRNTGNEFARNFSNANQSFMSSLGFYVTDNLYFGKHGLSLKLRGMDDDFNSNAMQRAVVMHGADYVSEEFIRKYGRLGRSLGCPALPADLNEQVVKLINDGTCLYIHYPAEEYHSKYLNTQFALQELLNSAPQNMAAATETAEYSVN